MARNDNFYNAAVSGEGRLPKNLRLNASEARDYFTGQDVEEEDHAITRQKYGRSSGTNN